MGSFPESTRVIAGSISDWARLATRTPKGAAPCDPRNLLAFGVGCD